MFCQNNLLSKPSVGISSIWELLIKKKNKRLIWDSKNRNADEIPTFQWMGKFSTRGFMRRMFQVFINKNTGRSQTQQNPGKCITIATETWQKQIKMRKFVWSK